MESFQKHESTMKIQDKPQKTHQIQPSFKQEKRGFEDSEMKDQDYQQHHKKRANEEQMKKPHECKKDEEEKSIEKVNDSGGVLGPRERLKKHRNEVTGKVWIPDIWGQEDFLKDWIDCSAFDSSLVPQGIMLARASLMEEGRRSNSNNLSLRVERSSC